MASVKEFSRFGPSLAGFLAPSGLQLSGYTNWNLAIACYVLAVIALLWPAYHWWLDRKKRVGPSLLIFLGVAGVLFFGTVALAGLIWQSRSSPTPPGTVETIEKRFTAYEIERQLKAIDDIKSTMTTDIKDIWLSGGILAKRVQTDALAGKAIASNSAGQLDEFANKSEGRLNSVKAKIETYKEYPFLDVLSIMKSPYTPFEVVVLSRNSAAIIRSFSSEADARFLIQNQDFAALGNALGRIGGWVADSEKRLLEERKRVEALPVYQ
jgi:hypothetical protein